jgi:hypothetical protein
MKFLHFLLCLPVNRRKNQEFSLMPHRWCAPVVQHRNPNVSLKNQVSNVSIFFNFFSLSYLILIIVREALVEVVFVFVVKNLKEGLNQLKMFKMSMWRQQLLLLLLPRQLNNDFTQKFGENLLFLLEAIWTAFKYLFIQLRKADW